jgi:hypothetical protein
MNYQGDVFVFIKSIGDDLRMLIYYIYVINRLITS